ncbi:MAG: radical SAM protein [Deltaproteobacteria bacterium]|nr:radical SAM protein [Deltaproteobacteria bacterium]
MQRILFLQLPRLENDLDGEEENLHLAAFYLSHALKKAHGDPGYTFRSLTHDEEMLDDAHLLDLIIRWAPDVVCATLYLWNIERTLHILHHLKTRIPHCLVVCGGPEVAPDHPFLFKRLIADIVVMGEGEAILSDILQALKEGYRTDYTHTAWKVDGTYQWGKNHTPVVGLKELLPPPEDPGWQPDSPQGMAYLETGRGCPMRCSYCRYSQMRRRPVFSEPAPILQSVKILRARGVEQIRFIDPTLNANPSFDILLKGLKALNSDHGVRFFAEVQADKLTTDQIIGLANAGFSELEAGVQSLNADVLGRIRRPVRVELLEGNIRFMTDQGIRVTIDLMYGLPGQGLDDVIHSLQWAERFKNAHVQCMQTLLLPGTELRETKDQWGIESDDRPPYGVRSTNTMTHGDIRTIEDFINQSQGSEGMARKFVGYRLLDLFEERVRVPIHARSKDKILPGRSSRRALIFQGSDLYSLRNGILDTLRQAMEEEPHILWQFVLMPEYEEPLDLLETMINEIRNHPIHWLDLFAHAACWDRIASRRVFVHLTKGRSYSAGWVRAAETLLEDHFY